MRDTVGKEWMIGMSVSVDISWKSLNKHGEELCGDKVEVLKTKDSEIVILAVES